jgi:hypothetical protein
VLHLITTIAGSASDISKSVQSSSLTDLILHSFPKITFPYIHPMMMTASIPTIIITKTKRQRQVLVVDCG